MKEISLLEKGIFDSPLLDSKATTRTVSRKEKILGHLIGPLGLIFVVNTIAALVEKFFTQQVGAMYGVGNVEMIKLSDFSQLFPPRLPAASGFSAAQVSAEALQTRTFYEPFLPSLPADFSSLTPSIHLQMLL